METDTNQGKLSALFERSSRVAGAAALALGLLVLLGWCFDIEILKNPVQRGAMKPNTALCFVLLGGALAMADKHAAPSRRATRIALSCLAALLGLLNVAEYLWRDLGIDQWLFREAYSPYTAPGRMAFLTAVSFVMLGAAIALLDVDARPGHRPSEWLSSLAVIPAVAGATDYTLDWRPDFTGIAVHTVAGLLLLCLGTLAARPTVGWMQTLSSRYGGGAAARRMLPFAILVPLIVGSLRWAGQQAGMYEQAIGVAIMTSVTVILLVVAVWWNARQLNLLDERRLAEAQRADEELRRRNRALLAMHECGQALVRASSEAELLKDICRVVVEQGGYRTAWVGFREDDPDKTVRFAAHYGISEEYARTANITWADGARGRGPAGSAIRTGKMQCCDDVLTDPRMLPWRESALAQGFRSTAVFPLMAAGTAFGTLSIYSAQAHAFHDEERHLLGRLADDLAYGIVTLRARVEREIAEKAAARASHYARNLIEACLDPLVTIRDDGRIMDVNHATELVTGLSREQLIGTDFADYFTEPDKARHGYERAFAERVVHDYPLTIRHRFGETTDVLYNATVYRNADGEVEGVFAAARDITERKRAEQRVLREQERYRSLVLATSLLVWSTDPHGEVEDIPGWRELTGQTAEQVKGWGWTSALHPDDLEPTRKVWTEALCNRVLYDAEYRVRNRDGEYRFLKARGVPVQDEDGRIREWVGTCEDITERKCAEQKLHQASLYARSLIEASLDPLVTISKRGRIMDVNHATELVTGYDRERLIGSDFCDYFTEPQKARSGYLQVFAEGTVHDYPLSIRHLSGPVTDVVYNAAVYRNAGGEIEGVFAAARDITERKRAEQQLVARTAELERSNRELQDFASIASHDLQEPLRKVQAFGDRLREHSASSLDETSRDYLRRMQNAAERMSSLIEALLAYSRVTTKARPFERVDLNRVAAEVLADLESRIQASGASIEIGTLPALMADSLQFRQLLQNLLANALKFHAPDKPPCVRVSSMRAPEGGWSIIVEDHGVGFDQVYVDRIFRPFQRLHGRNEFEGSGMGLAICRKIVERHGGEISARSRPGEGSVFTVTLPANPEEENDYATTDTARHLDRRG